MDIKHIGKVFTKFFQYSDRKMAIGSLLVALVVAIATALQAIVIFKERVTPYKTITYQQQLESASQILILSRRVWGNASIFKTPPVSEHLSGFPTSFRKEAQQGALNAYIKNYMELEDALSKAALTLPREIYVTAQRLVNTLGDPITNARISGTILTIDNELVARSLKKASSEYASFANVTRRYFGIDRLSDDIKTLLGLPPVPLLSLKPIVEP